MKDIIRQPAFYYIAVPAVLLIWPVMVGLVYLPDIEQNWKAESKNYTEAVTIISEIGKLDPQRITNRNKAEGSKFDYTSAMDTTARKLGIPSANYTVSSKDVRKSQGGKTRDCQVAVVEIDITKLSKFLSDLQASWTNLQCQKLTITKKKGLKDAWKANLTFRYYY